MTTATTPLTREAHIAEWTETKACALDAHRTIVDNAIAAGTRRVKGEGVDIALTAIEELLERCDDELHYSTVMQLDTEAMAAERRAEARAAAADPDRCPFCRGTGYVPHFSHVANGVCFRCDGKGR